MDTVVWIALMMFATSAVVTAWAIVLGLIVSYDEGTMKSFLTSLVVWMLPSLALYLFIIHQLLKLL